MSEPHDHHDHVPKVSTPDSGVQDVGSRALAEALGSSFLFVKIVMVLLVIVFLASGMVTVGYQERAVILRFGKAQGRGQAQLLGPGLHFAFPPPIDEVVKISIGEIQTVTSTVGWYATPQQEAAGTVPPPRGSLNPSTDGYILTGDGNVVHARAIIGYRVTDALAYALNFVGASNVVQTVLDNALVWASARMTVDDAIKSTDVIKEKVMARFTQLADELNLGITLDTMTVTVAPPRYIKESFDAVTSAQQTRDGEISRARGEADTLLATARAEANAVVDIGRAARTRHVEAIAAEARSFSEQLPEYKKNPELFRQRLRTETWQRVLANASDKILIPDRADGKQRELRILLNREPEKPRTNSPAGSR